MPNLPFLIITITADLVIFIFIGYYLLELRTRKKELEKKERKIDTDYHQIVDTALSRERRILEDATIEADQIISGATEISTTSKAMVEQALSQMVTDIHKEATDSARLFMKSYQATLKQLAIQSLTDFQKVSKELEIDLQKQVKDFNATLLPTMEHELELYKQARIKETELLVTRVVQKVSQVVLNKSLSLEDHQKLMIDALEKAQKEELFD